MKILALGFDEAAMTFLADGLKAQGHSILGASDASMASSFLNAAPWDALIVPVGQEGESAKRWALEKAGEHRVLAVSPDATGLAELLGGAASTQAIAGTTTQETTPSVDLEWIAPAASSKLTTSTPGTEADLVTIGDYQPSYEDWRPSPSDTSEKVELSLGDPTRRTRRPQSESDTREPHPDLLAKLAQVRFGDYHSILEVEPGGSQYAVREQRERLLHRFSPRGWPARLSPEEIEMLDEIAKGIADAFLILGDAELAARYERALAQGSAQEYNAPEATQARAIDAHLLQVPPR